MLAASDCNPGKFLQHVATTVHDQGLIAQTTYGNSNFAVFDHDDSYFAT